MVGWIISLVIAIIITVIFRNNPNAKIWMLYHAGQSGIKSQKIPFWGGGWVVIQWPVSYTHLTLPTILRV